MVKTISAAGCHLYLIRHGESANNALADSQRVSDPALTELGHEQAHQLAQRYRNLDRIDQVLSSGFRRTMQTAQPMLEAHDIRATIWTDLFEVGGCFSGYKPREMEGAPGMTHAQIAAEFPRFDIPDDIDEQGWYKCRPVETRELAVFRASDQAMRLRNTFEQTDQIVLCFIHADFKQLLLQQLLPDMPEYHIGDIPNTGVTHIHFKNGRPTVLTYCDTAHLTSTAFANDTNSQS